ncbi:energy transducer TonB [Alteromonas sp. ASW11-36]|uniref:Energy transducer TonB n=1 Tax=Alteromonas arenosi TaxID=3055817 RepID=A0ABT7SSC0_9ALTE|nr:energy transducer TonB [Alteromonas sp. ASW11-36]MDM7859090.1 energy transducer TonB [Alteromonas sp. ASW11-36]
MKKNSIIAALFVATAGLLLSPLSGANQDRVVLQTDVIETLLVPETADALSWQRVFPEQLSMPRGAVRAGAKGCAIFSFNINSDGEPTNITTEKVVPSFGLRRHAKNYLESWRFEPKSEDGGIEESVLLRLDFCTGGATQEEATAICEYQATLPCSK